MSDDQKGMEVAEELDRRALIYKDIRRSTPQPKSELAEIAGVVATALAEARAAGFREGVEKAAETVEKMRKEYGATIKRVSALGYADYMQPIMTTLSETADEIRALLPGEANDGDKAPLQNQLCKCGHPRSDHYEYLLNGHPQVRCKACDPFTGLRGGGPYAIVSGSPVEVAYHAADHDFESVESEVGR